MELPPTPQEAEATAGEVYVHTFPSPEMDDCDTPHERLHLFQHFRSDFLPDTRNLIVYVPPQYAAEPQRHFPVLYMHDGQNLFDGRTSFIPNCTWEVQQSADAAIEAGQVEPLIIVGIYNTGPRRIAEYTPTRDWKMGGGEANAYGRLIVDELIPFIGKRYRTLQGREHTGLGGSSLGGLVSLYLGLEYQHIFGRLAVLSPSVWWNHRSILNLLRAATIEERARIWLDTGDAEGARTVEDTNRLYTQLIKCGWEPDGDASKGNLHYEVASGGTHSEEAWATRVWPMLRFLFPQK